MTKILLDTNVILDLVLARHPFLISTEALFKKLDPVSLTAFVSASAITDIYYLIAKAKNKEVSRGFLTQITTIVGVVPVSQEVVNAALASPMKDFEDAIQAYAAFFAGMDVLITRNESDFALAPLPVKSPVAFLAQF